MKLSLNLLAALISALLSVSCDAAPAQASPLPSPSYNESFWKLWGDGQAELAAYEIVVPRYGEPRKGTAVAIFVTEPFSDALRVKSDRGRRTGSDATFQVLKLNFVEDFPTGVYDYNMMTSAFVALESIPGARAGAPAKVAFSAQEWCGQVWHQLVFREREVDETLHSYFEGEADQVTALPSREAVAEDAILVWARGLAWPKLERGASATVPMMPSLSVARLTHRKLAWTTAQLEFVAEGARVSVPAGEFDCDVMKATIEGGRSWTIWVERVAPRRIIRWSIGDGGSGALLGAKRMKYWQMNAPGFETSLKEIGLTPRPAATP